MLPRRACTKRGSSAFKQKRARLVEAVDNAVVVLRPVTKVGSSPEGDLVTRVRKTPAAPNEQAAVQKLPR